MNDLISSVWSELGKTRQRKILLCVMYREWQYMDQSDDTSSSIEAQLHRWISFLSQWETAIQEGREICVLGDTNLNYFHWFNQNQQIPAHSRKLQPLVMQIFERIIPHGFVQLVKVATRIVKGQEPSCLDHIYTNHPEKYSNIETH